MYVFKVKILLWFSLKFRPIDRYICGSSLRVIFVFFHLYACFPIRSCIQLHIPKYFALSSRGIGNCSRYIYISNDRYIKGVCIIMRTGFRWSSIILQYISEFNLVIPIVALPSILIILITQIFPFTLERRHPSNSSYFYPILS